MRKAYEKFHGVNLSEDDIIDIAVSYDGSWLTRGFKSKIGIGCVVDLLTGLCIDWHVVSSYCHTCETTGAQKKKLGNTMKHGWKSTNHTVKRTTRSFSGQVLSEARLEEG